MRQDKLIETGIVKSTFCLCVKLSCNLRKRVCILDSRKGKVSEQSTTEKMISVQTPYLEFESLALTMFIISRVGKISPACTHALDLSSRIFNFGVVASTTSKDCRLSLLCQ